MQNTGLQLTIQKPLWHFRLYSGVGIPLLGSDTNRTLPFFKQYIGGGSNSMRGWPLRGIGIGGKAMTPYGLAAALMTEQVICRLKAIWNSVMT